MITVIIALLVGGFTWMLIKVIDLRKYKAGNKTAKIAKSDRTVESCRTGKSTETVTARSGIERLTYYSQYSMSFREKRNATILAIGLLYLVGFIFYKNPIIAATISLLGFYYPRIRVKELIRKRKGELTVQFKQALYSISSSLAAGKSLENSFSSAIDDLQLLYPTSEAFIIQELNIVQHRIENGEPIEDGLADFSERADIQDIRSFVEILIACKRTGGDLVEVIRKTANMIGDKLEIQQDIAVMVAQKNFEAKILAVIPVIIVAFLSFGSADYMAPLYEGVGYVIMTASLLVLLLSAWVMNRITNIAV